jgi:hypothetical protein
MIQDLVPDREICQEAKDKGVVIESSFYWTELNGEWFTIDVLDGYSIPKGDEDRFIPAPLTDEILKVLPERIVKSVDEVYILSIIKTTNGYIVMYFCDGYVKGDIHYIFRFEDKKLSNALLLLAIKLKEEKIIV